jgi:hypothetical protein
MAQTFGGGFAVINTVGFTAATGAASARSTIPVDTSGNRPNYIRVAAINESYVKLGDVTVTATTNDILIQPADAIYLQVGKAVTHIAYIQGTAAGKINVSPLDNS